MSALDVTVRRDPSGGVNLAVELSTDQRLVINVHPEHHSVSKWHVMTRWQRRRARARTWVDIEVSQVAVLDTRTFTSEVLA